jgi:fatty-acyl-CoA synthase
VILQYTSGSTSEPKGVMIPDRVLSANIDACCEAAELGIGETMVSWLPLYHDMGLVGFLALPMTKGVDLVQAAPQDFMAKPGNWMQWISDFGGTATAGPNFSWVLATRALKRAEGLDLSTLTLALSGAEPVDPKAVDAFVAAAEPFGFRAGSVFPAFGMAETAIGASFPKRGAGLQCDTVDREVLERTRVAKRVEIDDVDDLAVRARRLPLLGTAVPGMEMKIADPDTREALPERHVGELLLRGSSVTPGYYKREAATRALFHDDWLCTGDLAYLLDGQLILCGRIKDVIIVGGRNVFPEDIERAVGGLDGVRAGNVIAFGMEGYKGKESVVVVAEIRADDLDAVRERIHHRTLEVCGLPPRDVMLVRPGTLPKTSSGKLQRARCREQYLAEDLELLDAG